MELHNNVGKLGVKECLTTSVLMWNCEWRCNSTHSWRSWQKPVLLSRNIWFEDNGQGLWSVWLRRRCPNFWCWTWCYGWIFVLVSINWGWTSSSYDFEPLATVSHDSPETCETLLIFRANLHTSTFSFFVFILQNNWYVLYFSSLILDETFFHMTFLLNTFLKIHEANCHQGNSNV